MAGVACIRFCLGSGWRRIQLTYPGEGEGEGSQSVGGWEGRLFVFFFPLFSSPLRAACILLLTPRVMETDQSK